MGLYYNKYRLKMFVNPRSRILLSKVAKYNGMQRSFGNSSQFPGESTFGLIKPDGFKHLGSILDIVYQEGFYIRALRMSQFTNATAKVFYDEHIGKEFFEPFREFVISGPVVAMRLGRLDAVKHWREVIGSTDSKIAKIEDPNSIRAKFGTNGRVNAVHGADCEDSAVKEMNFFFSQNSLMKRYFHQYFLIP